MSSAAADAKLAERYLMMRMEDSALHYCMQALEKDPDHLLGKVTLARVFVAKGMGSQARDALAGLEMGAGADPQVLAVLQDIQGIGTAQRSSPRDVAVAVPRVAEGEAELAALFDFRQALEDARGTR